MHNYTLSYLVVQNSEVRRKILPFFFLLLTAIHLQQQPKKTQLENMKSRENGWQFERGILDQDKHVRA